jgi:hypothetical protein
MEYTGQSNMVAPVWDGWTDERTDRQRERKSDDDSIRRQFLFTTSYKLVAYSSKGCPTFRAHSVMLHVTQCLFWHNEYSKHSTECSLGLKHLVMRAVKVTIHTFLILILDRGWVCQLHAPAALCMIHCIEGWVRKGARWQSSAAVQPEVGHFLSYQNFCHITLSVVSHFLSYHTFCRITPSVISHFLSYHTFGHITPAVMLSRPIYSRTRL